MSGVHRQPVGVGSKGALLSSICSLTTQGIKGASHIAAVMGAGADDWTNKSFPLTILSGRERLAGALDSKIGIESQTR